MNAEELRIGNLVTIDNPKAWPLLKGVILIVTGVDNKTDIHFPNSTGSVSLYGKDKFFSNTYSQFDEFIKPIPLTEEWLLKAGFERLPHMNITNALIKDIGRNRIISIGNVGTANEMVWLCEVSATDPKTIVDLICIRNYDYDGRTFVHHIQNIHHDLSGTELEIKQ